MSDVPPQEVPVSRAYAESEVEYLLALCTRLGLGQWAALANNAAPWRTRTALGSIIVNSEHGSWLGTERGKRIWGKYCGMNTADWLAAVKDLRKEVLKNSRSTTPRLGTSSFRPISWTWPRCLPRTLMRLSERGHVAPVHHLLGHCMVPKQRPDETEKGRVSAANPHLLRFSQICPRLATFWSFSLLRRNRRLAAQSQDQTYIFLICRI